MLTLRLCELCERGKVESVIRIDRQAERERGWRESSKVEEVVRWTVMGKENKGKE